MGLFESSTTWVIAVGKTTVHSIWIGLLILALLRLTLAYIPVRFAAIRYNISVSALLLLFISVLATFFLIYEPFSPIQESQLIQGNKQGELIFGTILIFRLFGYIYFAGVLIMMIRSWASLAYVRGLRKCGNQFDYQWHFRFEQISRSLGIKRPVDFLESTRVKAPLLIGYLKPAIIIPVGMVSNLPISQIETILLHELYHLKRRDYLVNIMQLFIEGILFYHPVVWIISGSIRSEREHCCDDRVLKACDNPINYAKALIHLAEQQHYTRLAPGAVGSRKNQFESRIKRILNYDTMRTNMRDKILSLTLLAGSFIILLTVSGFSAGPSFFRVQKTNSDLTLQSAAPIEIVHPDTIPQKKQQAELEAVVEPEELEEFEEFEWEAMEIEIEAALHEALEAVEEIDWEDVRLEMELNISDMKVDMEEMKIEIQNSINGIDWDEIREDIRIDMEISKVFLDSLKIEMDL